MCSKLNCFFVFILFGKILFCTFFDFFLFTFIELFSYRWFNLREKASLGVMLHMVALTNRWSSLLFQMVNRWKVPQRQPLPLSWKEVEERKNNFYFFVNLNLSSWEMNDNENDYFSYLDFSFSSTWDMHQKDLWRNLS